MRRSHVVLACRLVSLWFFFQAGLEFFGFVNGLISLSYYEAARFMNLYSTGLERMKALGSVTTILEFAAEIAVGVLFYRCGPGVVQFLFADTLDEPDVQSQVAGGGEL